MVKIRSITYFTLIAGMSLQCTDDENDNRQIYLESVHSTSTASKTFYTYGPDRHVISKKIVPQWSGANYAFIEEYIYEGNLISRSISKMKYDNGTEGAADTIEYIYDNDLLVAKKQVAGGPVDLYIYNSTGQLTSKILKLPGGDTLSRISFTYPNQITHNPAAYIAENRYSFRGVSVIQTCTGEYEYDNRKTPDSFLNLFRSLQTDNNLTNQHHEGCSGYPGREAGNYPMTYEIDKDGKVVKAISTWSKDTLSYSYVAK